MQFTKNLLAYLSAGSKPKNKIKHTCKNNSI